MTEAPTSAPSSNNEQLTCVDIDLDSVITCGGVIDYQVASSLNQNEADGLALLGSSNAAGCAYITMLPWQCRKHFAPCTIHDDTEKEALVEWKGNRICKYSCYQLRATSDGICQGFSDDYFGEECNTEYYANPGDEGGCLPYSFTTNLAGDWWSISIVLISVGMTIFLGFSFYKRWSESHRAQLVHLLAADVPVLENRPDNISMMSVSANNGASSPNNVNNLTNPINSNLEIKNMVRAGTFDDVNISPLGSDPEDDEPEDQKSHNDNGSSSLTNIDLNYLHSNHEFSSQDMVFTGGSTGQIVSGLGVSASTDEVIASAGPRASPNAPSLTGQL